MVPLVKKITRVQTTKTSVTRWDLLCNATDQLALLEALKNGTDINKRQIWHVKVSQSFYARRAAKGRGGRPTRPVLATRKVGDVKMVSVNVRGVTSQVVELSNLALRDNISVLLLQETLRDETAWPIRIPGFNIVGEQFMAGTGQRGVMVAVRAGLTASPMEPSNPYVQWAQVFVGTNFWLVGSLYLPTQVGSLRNKAIASVKVTISTLMKKFPNTPMVMAGDFNCNAEKVTKMLGKWNVGLSRMECRAPSATYHNKSGKIMSDLDHFVVNNVASAKIGGDSTVSVNRLWEISDHWPVCGRFISGNERVKSSEDVEGGLHSKVRMDPYKVRECGSDIAHHALFDTLANDLRASLAALPIDHNGQANREDLIAIIDKNTEALHTASLAVAADLQLNAVKPRTSSKQGLNISRSLQRLISRKRNLIKNREGLRSELVVRQAELIQVEQDLRTISTQIKAAVREQMAKDHKRCIVEGTQRFLKGTIKDDTSAIPFKKRLFWDWLRKVSGSTSARGGQSCAVTGDDGELKSKPSAIRQAWTDHFCRLATAVEEADRHEEAWEDRLSHLPDLPELPGLSDQLSWAEVQRVIKSMKNWKASGTSGIIVEFFKYSIAEEGNEDAANPPSPLRQVLLSLLQLMFDNSHLAVTLTAAELVTVPKKGDLSNRNNYRGISLIEVIIKILMTVVTRRISDGLEKTERITPAQAGFRSKEEVVAQVVTLYDICKRREHAGKPTLVAFIDMVKAYDCVPQGASLFKANRIGVKNKVLNLLRNVYKSAVCSVRGSGVVFPLERGLRQGGPSSPDEFKIFVNDFLGTQVGVEVPYSNPPLYVPGLLLADDAVILTESIPAMQQVLDEKQEWANTNGMSFGLSKCGVMMIGPATETEANLATLKAAVITLNGDEIPVVSSYMYLGGVFRSDLSLDGLVADRNMKAKRAVGAVAPILSNVCIPLAMRRLTVLAFVQPTLTYVGELLGMGFKYTTEGLQTTMGNALRMIAMGRGPAVRPSLTAVMVELGLPPVYACLAGLRARAFAKYHKSKTYVAQLYDTNKKLSCVWSEGGSKWLSSNAPPLVVFDTICKKYLKDNNKECFTSYREVPSKVLAKKIKWRAAEKIWKACTDTTYTRYAEANFRGSASYIKRTAEFGAPFACGVQRIFQIRCGSFMTGHRAAVMELIHSKYHARCVCCEQEVVGGESVSHMIFSCKTWSDERQVLLPLATALNVLSTHYDMIFSSRQRETLILGGEVTIEENVNICLDGAEQSWCLGNLTDKDVGTRETPLCLYLAQFLTSIDKRRSRLLQAAIGTGPEVEILDDTLLDSEAQDGDVEPEICPLLEDSSDADTHARAVSPTFVDPGSCSLLSDE